MNHLEPRTSHPLLWALEEVLGLTADFISAHVDISRATLARIRDGRTPKRDQVVDLAALCRKMCDRIAREMSPPYSFTRKKPDPPYRYWHRSHELMHWRRATFDLLNHLIRTYTHPAVAQPVQTTLGHELVAVVGRGKDRDLVFAHFRTTQRKHLRKLAKRIGVREQTRDGVVYWLPPEDLPAINRLQLPDVPQRMRNTPRALKIQAALEAYLERHEKAHCRDAIAYVISRTGCTRPAVYRAARDLCVVREMSGFGATKTSVWRMPPKPKKENP